MESRILLLFLRTLLVTLSTCVALGPALAAEDGENSQETPVIDPQVDRREVRPAKIDTEDIEIGAYVGLMSIEDFGTNTVVGARLAYHITERLFFEATYGQTTAEETSFEVSYCRVRGN